MATLSFSLGFKISSGMGCRRTRGLHRGGFREFGGGDVSQSGPREFVALRARDIFSTFIIRIFVSGGDSDFANVSATWGGTDLGFCFHSYIILCYLGFVKSFFWWPSTRRLFISAESAS